MDHQVAAAPDGDEVALHSRAHETNQSIRSSGGQFGQVCDVVVVPRYSEVGEARAATDSKNAPEIGPPSNGGGFSGGTTGTAIQSLTCLKREEGWREKNKSGTDRKWVKESEAAAEGGIS